MTIPVVTLRSVPNVAMILSLCAGVSLVSSCSFGVLPGSSSKGARTPDKIADDSRATFDPADMHKAVVPENGSSVGVATALWRVTLQVREALFRDHWVSLALNPDSPPAASDDREAPPAARGAEDGSQTMENARYADRVGNPPVPARPSEPKERLTRSPSAPPMKRVVEARIDQALQRGALEEIFPKSKTVQVATVTQSISRQKQRIAPERRPASDVKAGAVKPSPKRTPASAQSAKKRQRAVADTVEREHRPPRNSSRAATKAAKSDTADARAFEPRKPVREVQAARPTNGLTPTNDASVSIQSNSTESKDGKYLVQIASMPTKLAAEEYWQKESSAIRSIVGRMGHRIQRIRLAEHRIFHRVQVGPYPRSAEAWSACHRLRSQGRSCFVLPSGADK